MKTKNDIIEEFEKFSYKKQVNVLYSALDYMNQYNGRSNTDCIVLAMNYEQIRHHLWKKKGEPKKGLVMEHDAMEKLIEIE